ncbi:DUF4232 domain-containing protein [Streptomyces sp. NPDC052051]|uniref:DUF4232 domain-containing protein n=1 Tax=Streptomyces sp. NPDC052051 TaxID=3154649 RepID=UPI0034416FBB
MRTFRHKTVLAAAVTVAALSMGLTACGGDATGTKDEGKAASSQSSATSTTEASAGAADSSGSNSGSADSGTAKGGSAAVQSAGKTSKGGSGTGSGGGTGKGSSAGGTSSGSTPVCAYSDVRIKAEKADETPTEHIVLTATNTSGHSCRLLQYPLIAFGPIQTAKDIPAVAKSKPGVPVVLQAGTSAYANVRIALGGAHEDNKVVTKFNVNLFAAEGPAEGSVVVNAPSGGLAVDEAAAKTGYWTDELRNGADEF